MNTPPASDAARKKQRLVLCLDGSWNRRDDNTNVLHHFAMTLESGPPNGAGAVIQKKYYDEGVGTGVLDAVTGGAFGFGLEENVRQAYNWLVENYHDGNTATATEADEIFIFGFSRGSYTARSLVNLIATFGLLRHGAPLSAKDLWKNYCILGREREQRKSFWDLVFNVKPSGLRRINHLTADSWEEPAAAATRKVPRPLEKDLTLSERLLVRWSRRVKITYLGIYDTVGAMGIDAIAIPGVKSKLAMHHNMRVTTLIQSCRHALAVDEHRISFSRTPLVEYIGHERGKSDQESRADWEQKQKTWRDRIQQRWFVGAHSNIGGGYPDNELSQPPLAWVLEGAVDAGLECEPFPFDGLKFHPEFQPREADSYAEFVRPIWTQIIRGKRHYRTIDPEPEVRANQTEGDAGFSLRNINEEIDPMVLDYFGQNDYRPPNVWDYAQRKKPPADPKEAPAGEIAEKDPAKAARKTRLRAITDVANRKANEPRHTWAGEDVSSHLILALWGTFAGVGMVALNHLFSALIDRKPGELPLPLWFVAGAAFVFTLVDWGESAANLSLAKGHQSARRRAFLDVMYWTRTLGFVLFVCGALATPVALWRLGWHLDTIVHALRNAWEQIEHWWAVPVAAALGVILGTWLDKAAWLRWKTALVGIGLACLAAYAAVVVVVALGWWFGQVFAPIWAHTSAKDLAPTKQTQVAGLLLLLQFGFFYLLNTFNWVKEPTSRRNLGSVAALQFCFTPGAVKRCLDDWQAALTCQWDPKDRETTDGPAARTMRETVREALWRDILGFIPLYGVVFFFGLYFAAWNLGWIWLQKDFVGLPLWAWLPAVAIAADLCEDRCHLHYVDLRAHKVTKPIPLGLTLFSSAMTCLKLATVLPAWALTSWALVDGTRHVAWLGQATGWRGTLAMLVSGLTAILVGVLLVARINLLRLWWRGKSGASD